MNFDKDEDRLSWVKKVLDAKGYDYVESLGSGGCATVHLVWSRQYRMQFAAKVVHAHNQTTFGAEVNSLKQLEHPNIINMYDHFDVGDGRQIIIMEYCPNGSLQDMINTQGPLSKQQANKYFKSITRALAACHEIGIAHRDIKPSNVLIDLYERPKLADFGLALECGRGDKTYDKAGSMAYSSPEMFRSEAHDPFKSDVWALGILYYIMITGRLPWTSPGRAVINDIFRGVTIVDERFNTDEKSMLVKMLSTDPTFRASLSDVLELRYFKERTVGKIMPSKSGNIPMASLLLKPKLMSSGSCLLKDRQSIASRSPVRVLQSLVLRSKF